MYTSGWPKNQNRCCQRIGVAAVGGVEDVRAEMAVGDSSISAAAVSTGNARSTSTLVTSMFQVKIGMRNIVMPGARMAETVVTMLTAVSTRGHAGEDDGDDPQVAADRGERMSSTAARSRSSRSWRRRRR